MSSKIYYPNQHAWQLVNAQLQQCDCGAAYGIKVINGKNEQVAISLWEKCTEGNK